MPYEYKVTYISQYNHITSRSLSGVTEIKNIIRTDENSLHQNSKYQTFTCLHLNTTHSVQQLRS